MAIELYPDQAVFVQAIRESLRSHRRIVAQAFCGFGKTVVAADIAKRVLARGKRILFAVHRREIQRQTALTFFREGIPFGVVGRDTIQNVMIGTMQSIRNRLGKLPADLLFIDEGHIYPPGFKDVHPYYESLRVPIVALTASPWRFGNRGMSDHYDTIVRGPSAKELIAAGRLSNYTLFAPPLASSEGLHTRQGEYIPAEAEAVMDKPHITGDAIGHWQRHALGLRTLVFCATVKHSKDVADAYNARGILAAHMDATTPDLDRRRIIGEFASGRLPIVTNCMLATEGFDLSAQVGRDVPVEAVQILRFTKSLALKTQICGRALRKKERPAIILDHVGMTEDFMPDDDIEWSLDGLPKREVRKTFTCKKCYGVFDRPFSVCPSCGAESERVSQGRVGPQQVEGELVEVDKAKARKKPVYDLEYRKAGRSLEALKEYAKARGFNERWATYRWNARQQKLSRA